MSPSSSLSLLGPTNATSEPGRSPSMRSWALQEEEHPSGIEQSSTTSEDLHRHQCARLRTLAGPTAGIGELAVLSDVHDLEADGAAVSVCVVAAKVEDQAFRGDRAGQAAPAALRVELD